MGKLVVINHVTLDGVMQGPGRADEDVRGGFAHGGWAVPGNDPVVGERMAQGMTGPGSLLLGRWTYESFASFWPAQPDNPYTDRLNSTTKYVASNTLREPLPWRNSVLLSGDACDGVAELKRRDEDLAVLGSGGLLRSLVLHDLVDEYLLMIHPLVLGSGRRLFPDQSRFATLRLVDSVTTTTGVIMATYERAPEPERAG